MQIHELTRKQPLNELDIAGPNGLIAGAKAAYGALKQPGGVKDALRTATPGQSQGFAGTADLIQSDFAKRMQAVKNNAAMKQVAANVQQQWEQTRKTLPAAQAAPAAQTPAAPAAKTTTAQPGFNASNIGNLKSTPGAITPPMAKPVVPATPQAPAPNFKQAPAGYSNVKTNAPGYGQVPKIQPTVAKPKPAGVRESIQLTEAASLAQITDWFTKSVIPRSAAGHEAEYLQNPTIQATLKNIAAAENQADDKERQKSQAAEFLNLVSAVAAETQVVQAKNPQAATTAGTGSAAPQAAGVQVATSQLQKLAGLNATQIEALKKIFSGAPQVTTGDPNTANFLQALGIKTS